MESASDYWGEPISVYTRAQAIDDGTLIDVSAVAREAGIKLPLAITRRVWADYVALPDGYSGCQDEAGRLWDVVWMTRHAIASARERTDRVYVTLRVRPVRADGCDALRVKRVTLWAVCGGGDDGAPVITVLCPDED